jgi:hypothetical protein
MHCFRKWQTGNCKFDEASTKMYESGKLFSEIGNLFKDAETINDLNDRIKKAGTIFLSVADLEEGIFRRLSNEI